MVNSNSPTYSPSVENPPLVADTKPSWFGSMMGEVEVVGWMILPRCPNKENGKKQQILMRNKPTILKKYISLSQIYHLWFTLKSTFVD